MALGDERGFTLPELLVTIMLLTIMLSALYGIFDASVRVFSMGNDRTEANENARLSLNRMEREIRAAYPPSSGTTLLLTNNPGEISFRHNPSGTPETVTYRRGALDGAGRGPLERNGQPVVDNVSALEFRYCSTPDSCTSISEANVRLVRISLTTSENGRDQTLTTDVYLRNRA
ncbi:PilW family protein [Rubrobacter indicoceani]|uniref:PilW family protein n=1 Tax=Rubrobacter indicoceani TaxID=2051957 RepID=UPI0013C45104|nr:prepilin-type N-terminal cleavage/methylation domain-containing protein [Rubrobacter indicoceani]